jgi:sortase A
MVELEAAAGLPDVADLPRPAPARVRRPGPRRPGPRRPVLHGTGVGLLLLAFVVLGSAGYLYGLSAVQEARDQSILYTRLQVELANQVAPLGPATPGAPVAILDIPSIGVRNLVVVEGTSPENLTLGPGHLRSSVLPGQGGVSEIFGRRATFGAPFARLAALRRGDIIRVITGQGVSIYTVAAVGGSTRVIRDPAPNRLDLVTASSPVIPAFFLDVDARLTSSPHPGPGAASVITAPELVLAGDTGALGLTMAWGLALALVSAGGTIAASRWSPWPAYLAAAPLLLAVLWNLYQSLAVLLPNVY